MILFIPWKKFLTAERIKLQQYKGVHSNNYFWRAHDRQEIDWVEDRDGKLFGHEFKFEENKNTSSLG